MTEHVPQLPAGWEITTVEITETTTYRIPVAHPQGASARAIAAAGHDDYTQEEHPETVFDHQPGEDEVRVRGEQQDSWGWPAWAARRPDHDAVVAILDATAGDGDGRAA